MKFSKDELMWAEEKINHYYNQCYFYLKFSQKEEWAKDICNGNLYANTAKYFRDLENKTKIKGQGDINETQLVLSNSNILVLEHGTNKIVSKRDNINFILNNEQDNDIPIVSFVGISLKELEIINVIKNKTIILKLPYNENECRKMENDFGKYCVIIPDDKICKSLKKYHNDYKINCALAPVEYCESNLMNKTLAHVKKDFNRFYYKDLYFSYQREHRLVLDMKIPKDNFIRIGKIDDAFIWNSNNLNDLTFQIDFEKNVLSIEKI